MDRALLEHVAVRYPRNHLAARGRRRKDKLSAVDDLRYGQTCGVRAPGPMNGTEQGTVADEFGRTGDVPTVQNCLRRRPGHCGGSVGLHYQNT